MSASDLEADARPRDGRVKPLAISLGDPAGVGPAVGVGAIAARRDDAFLVFGDATWLGRALRDRGIEPTEASAAMAPGAVALVDVARWDEDMVRAHRPTAVGGRAQLIALDAAIDSVASGRARGLVTGPVSKEAICLSGVPFVGHTERLAERAGLAPDAVTMLFLGPRLRVALVTTHASVRDAAAAVSSARVERSLRHLVEALHRLGLPRPRIEVTGVNPHAGEGGLFGDEERHVEVALARLLPLANAEIAGPIPAEASFRRAASGAIDGVVAMLHDQATIASKLLDWGAAVNVTWGLPYVRTSVDHGVAYDAAAADAAEPEGMIAAIDMARLLTA
ncbi:MAG: 4-hydroxythreonine-4-phosphate dehydrogenase PdxA [Myxococcales bacterium]|nr:4-hydroxythreonine-4-phosphate dehydrogenase PdxA [Myxococcales bacterium]